MSKGSQQDMEEQEQLEAEIQDDGSLCGSSLDFEENPDEEESDDDKATQLKSYDHVPSAINTQKFISESKEQNEMMSHFDKIEKNYGANCEEKEVELKDDTAMSPARYTSEYITSQNKAGKNGSFSSNYSKSFK